MKTIRNVFFSVAIVAMSLMFLNSTSPSAIEENNGVIVQVIKGQTWTYTNGCGQVVATDKTTRQFKNGQVHMITLIFDLPEDNCSRPTDKAYRGSIGAFDIVYTPSGKMIAKLILN